MTILSDRRDLFTLSAASEDIGEIYQQIALGLPKLGFTNVNNETGHVFGEHDGTVLDVLYLFMGGRQFWQVVLCAGDQQATNDQLMDEVRTMIGNFSNL